MKYIRNLIMPLRASNLKYHELKHVVIVGCAQVKFSDTLILFSTCDPFPLGTQGEVEGGGGWKGVNLTLYTLSFKQKKSKIFRNIFFGGVDCLLFLRVISLGRVVLPSPRIVINLPRAYKKLHCKGESYCFHRLVRYFATDKKIIGCTEQYFSMWSESGSH